MAWAMTRHERDFDPQWPGGSAAGGVREEAQPVAGAAGAAPPGP